MDEWPLDDIELKTTHKDLYKMIVAKMGEVSAYHWKELKEVQKNGFDKMLDHSRLFEDLNKICRPYNEAIVNAKPNPFL